MDKIAPKNFRRTRIRGENLLEYLNKVNFSSRNKEIARKYVGGIPYKALAEEYGMTVGGIAFIIREYTLKSLRIKRQETEKD